LFLAFAQKPVSVEVDLPPGKWHKRLDSTDRTWHGRGPKLADRLHVRGATRITLSRRSVTLFERPRSSPSRL
jgi:hypothetical protein